MTIKLSNRLLVPFLNAVIIGVLMIPAGQITGRMGFWVTWGVVAGVLLGMPVEFGLGRLGLKSWLYQRRLTLLALFELIIVIIFVWPWIYIVFVTQPAPAQICCTTPADFGAKYQEVRFEGAGGVELAGWYIPPTASHGATIILLHGSGGNRLGMLWYAKTLAEKGYGVLLYDQRALGESQGAYQSWGWLDVEDLSHAVDFLITQKGVNSQRIGVVGASLGGTIALAAAGSDPRLAAIVDDGGGVMRVKDYPELVTPYEYFSYYYSFIIEPLLAFYLGISLPEPLIDEIPRIEPRPILFIAGGAEDLEVRGIRRLFAVAGPSAELWIIPDGHHVGGPAQIPAEYAARLLDFFDHALVEQSSPPDD